MPRLIPLLSIQRLIFTLAATSFGLTASGQSTAPRNGPPAVSPAGREDPVVLSPFQVDATAEQGYLATQTLSGTRLKTDLRDIGSALTIFTEQMMNDLAVNNLNDVLNFAPNTDTFYNRLTEGGNGNDFITQATQYVTRGGTTSTVGQDFFTNNIPPDRYNSEAFTFTRGPNAILFGLGNPAGAFVSSTKRAKNRTATTIEFQTDDRESKRVTVDHNQVIKKDFLSLRYAGLYTKLNGFREPSETFQRRHFVTARLTPFKTTVVRFNHEQGHLRIPAIRPWPVYDSISPWLAAGSPLLATLGAPKPAGISNYPFAGPVSVQFSPAGTQVPPMRWLNQGQSTLADWSNGFPVASPPSRRSFINPAIYPTFASAFGLSSYRLTDFKITSVFVEQQVTKDFFVEAAVNRVVSDVVAVNGFTGDNDILMADVNRLLPNGAPNPNVGKLYTESNTNILVQPERTTNKRLMASYELDLTRRSANWLRHLGRHRAAVFFEESDRNSHSTQISVQNTTPLVTTGVAGSILNAANLMRYRYYYEPASGRVGNPGGPYETFPIIYAGMPLPPPDPSGVTQAYLAGSAGYNSNASNLRTSAFALQSLFWGGRLVVTTGLRQDSQRAWNAVLADYAPWADARGIYPNPVGFDIRKVFPRGPREASGRTGTHGAVFHALSWLSLSYNQSDNFQINSDRRSVYGNFLPNPVGKGRDYGLKFALFDRRLHLDVTYYENFAEDKIDAISATPAGSFIQEINQIWPAIAEFTNDPKYRDFPYWSAGSGWADSATTRSSGWEVSATANPTTQWRVTINGSKRGSSATTARGPNIKRYLAEFLPLWRANPQWLALTNTASGFSVATRVSRLETTLANFEAIGSLPEDAYAPSWGANLIQTYSFAPESRLKGFAIGSSMNVRGRTVHGFAESAAGILVPTRPYYAPRNELFGAWLTYQRKLFRDRVGWRLQLNVRNLFDAYTVFPLRAVDRRDGTGAGTNVFYRLSEPRTYTLTSSFGF
jgi:iron complex outermembrane receptor protein